MLSKSYNIPFEILSKIWPNLADILTGILIFWYLIKKDLKPKIACFWSLVFILNPISILISSAHGQIDSIPSFLTLLSMILITKYSKITLAALIFGLAIAIKPNPLMLLPFFLFYYKLDLKKMLIFLTLSILPICVLMIPFLQDNTFHVITKLLNYSGATDFGIPGILRGFYFYQTGNYPLIFHDSFLLINKLIFFLGLFFILILYNRSQRLNLAISTSYLLFLSVYFGVSAQYLSWVLPFTIIERQKLVIPYSIAGMISLLGFYLFLNPLILNSHFTITPKQNQYMTIYLIGNIFLTITTFWWLFKALKMLKINTK